MSNVTIYEIAEEAGCSPSTVSRVINGYPYVKKATRAKVLKLIETKNYVPNETARNLVTQSTHMIGILLSDIRTTQHTDGIYYIEKELSKHGYSCIICNTGSSHDSMTSYIQMLSQRNVEAIILMGSTYENEEVEKAVSLYTPNIPVVICNGSLSGENTYSIVCDEDDGVYNSVKLLHDSGCRSLAFVYDNLTPSNRRKMEGFRKGAAEYGYVLDNRIVNAHGETDDMYRVIRDFIESHPDTDGIVFSEDFIAVVALRLFYDLGIKVPDDIQVIGINNSRFAETGIPPVTSLDNRLYDISITAVRTVLSLLKGETATKKVLVFSEIVKRKSTKQS